MPTPPVLTAERIDAMLSVMAEVCLESVVEAGRRQAAAEEVEAFERAGRALQGACRNLRQAIVLKQRFDREEAAKAAEARKAADAVRAEAEREHRGAVARHHTRVRRHFERVLWEDYDDKDAQDLFEHVDDCLTDLSEAPDFLQTPAETLIQRLADEIGLGDADDPPDAAMDAVPEPVIPEPVVPEPFVAERAAVEPAPEPAAIRRVAVQAEAPPAAAPPSELPAPARPPDPPPEPYIPPWEHLRRGRIAPGGTGW